MQTDSVAQRRVCAVWKGRANRDGLVVAKQVGHVGRASWDLAVKHLHGTDFIWVRIKQEIIKISPVLFLFNNIVLTHNDLPWLVLIMRCWAKSSTWTTVTPFRKWYKLKIKKYSTLFGLGLSGCTDGGVVGNLPFILQNCCFLDTHNPDFLPAGIEAPLESLLIVHVLFCFFDMLMQVVLLSWCTESEETRKTRTRINKIKKKKTERSVTFFF